MQHDFSPRLTTIRDKARPKRAWAALLTTAIAIIVLLVLLPGEEAQAKRTEIPLNLDLPSSEILSFDENIEALPPSTPWQEFTIQNGDNLSKLFERAGLGARDVHEIVTTSQQAKPLTTMNVGQQVSMRIEDSRLMALKIQKSKLETLLYERAADGFSTTEIVREPEVRTKIASAEITSSLYLAAEAANLPQSLIMELANVFGGVIDFVYDVRVGDHFIVIYEDLYLDGEHFKSGNVLAAQYINQGKRYSAFRYTDSKGDSGYYAPDGESMQKAFLRAPLDFSRISSQFDPKRLHPVFKTVRPHRGIDYAAARGTPVYAAGDGRVIEAGYSKANGNYVIIQHGQQYITKYLHLDRRAVRKGKSVKQRQIIGWVGSTGYATGPHLHYEFLVNGVHRNPRTIVDKLPKAKHIPSAEIAEFQQQTRGVRLQLSTYAAQAGFGGPDAVGDG